MGGIREGAQGGNFSATRSRDFTLNSHPIISHHTLLSLFSFNFCISHHKLSLFLFNFCSVHDDEREREEMMKRERERDLFVYIDKFL